MIKQILIYEEMQRIARELRLLQGRLMAVGLVTVAVQVGGAAQKVEVKIEEAKR